MHVIIFLFCFVFFDSGYAPRYSSVEDPTYSLHGSLGYDPNLDNSVFEEQPQHQVGAPRAIFDEDERQREPSPDNKMNFGGQQRGWLHFLLSSYSEDPYYGFIRYSDHGDLSNFWIGPLTKWWSEFRSTAR